VTPLLSKFNQLNPHGTKIAARGRGVRAEGIDTYTERYTARGRKEEERPKLVASREGEEEEEEETSVCDHSSLLSLSLSRMRIATSLSCIRTATARLLLYTPPPCQSWS
jgi:hypothetical protein